MFNLYFGKHYSSGFSIAPHKCVEYFTLSLLFLSFGIDNVIYSFCAFYKPKLQRLAKVSSIQNKKVKVIIVYHLFSGYSMSVKYTYVTAWGRTTTPPVHRLGLRGESVAIASFIKPVSREKEKKNHYCGDKSKVLWLLPRNSLPKRP